MKKILLTLLGLLIVSMLGVFIFVDDFDIEVPEKTVQSAIDKKITSGPIEHFGTQLHLRAAAIDFRANNTAILDVNFDVSGFGYNGKVTGKTAAGILYKTPRLYLANLESDKLDVQLDAETNDKLKDITNVAKDFLQRQREEMLTDEARKSLDNLITGDDNAVRRKTQAAVAWFVSTMPIYNLNTAGLKGSAASLALKDVRFTEDSAIVTLSARQAILKILTFFGIMLLVIGCYSLNLIPGLALGKAVAAAGPSKRTSRSNEEE